MKEQLESLINQLVETGISYEDAVCEFEKRFIRRVLEKSNGNRCKAADMMGIHRNTLSRKIEDLGLNHHPRRRRRNSRTAR